MLLFGRLVSLVSPATPESILVRLARHVTTEPTPGVPFAGRVVANEFRLHPVWTWTPRGAPSSDARRAFRVPVCSVHGTVAAAGEGARIGVRVRLMWPLPAFLLFWTGLYLNGLRSHPLGSDDLTIIAMALFFWSICASFTAKVIRGSIQEVRRLTLAHPEPDSRRA